MTSRATRLFLIAGALALLAGPSLAQTPSATYDVAKETTLTGAVSEVLTRDAEGGLHMVLLLKTADEELDVYVGPVMFVAAGNFSFMCDDDITVVGSKVRMEGKNRILAREIRKAGKTLKLRNENGVPLWPPAPALTSR